MESALHATLDEYVPSTNSFTEKQLIGEPAAVMACQRLPFPWSYDMGHPRVTWDWIRSLIHDGCGIGHGFFYRPLLEIRRWNPSPVSVQVRKALPPDFRLCHFFSKSEWQVALLLAWLGASVREQFPMWPWPHNHPLLGLIPDLDRNLPWCQGMEAVCKSAGIRHGTWPGTDIPYIWTIDLNVTIPWAGSDHPLVCFISIKPIESERFQHVDPLDRGAEKLEAERRFAQAINARHFIGDASLYSDELLSQLECWVTAAELTDAAHCWPVFQDFLDKHGHELQRHPPTEWIMRLERDFKVRKATADYLIHHCIWHQIIDIDPSRLVNLTECPVPGGRLLREELRKTILKDAT